MMPVSVPAPVLNVGDPVGAEADDAESVALALAEMADENEVDADTLPITDDAADVGTEERPEDGAMDADDV